MSCHSLLSAPTSFSTLLCPPCPFRALRSGYWNSIKRIYHCARGRKITSEYRSFGTMDRTKPPFSAQDPQEIGQLLKALNEHIRKGKGKGGFLVRKKTFDSPAGGGGAVDSWQLNDWDYKKPNLPTYARGLFTSSDNGKPEIVVRGYDKFFNIDEVNNTQWRNIEHKTRGPYELSVKENGCIIFIAGINDETLIVTSKHSMGPREDASANHAFAGERWIEKQLAALGKTKADLAKTLRKMNATAVAELCDDEFEEHVLEYSPDKAGLYLHGINLNLPEFATYPGTLIDEFAEDWGFRKVQYLLMNDLQDVRPFLEQVAETGNYNGRDTEGFVIRCQIRQTSDAPYQDWFFKYKFEEPYLMYRQWREVTKAIIAGKPPKYNKHKQITSEYITYARRQLMQNPSIGKKFNQNHGIIAMRDGFLAEKGLRGSDIIQSEAANGDAPGTEITKNLVLTTVATIGCGKTTVANALVKLFQWGHEQNDNITGKKDRPRRFAMAVTNSLTAHPVTIADRNNHQRRERQQIIDEVKEVVPDATFVALHYVHEPGDYDKIRKATQNRVLARGDNHQTIQAGSKDSSEIVAIMEGFLHRFQPVDVNRAPDNAFDLVINLDATVESRENLETVVHKLHEKYPSLFDMPTSEDMDAAIESTLNDYKPDVKHDLSFKDTKHNKVAGKQKSNSNDVSASKTTNKPPRIEYFGIYLPAQRVSAIIEAVFASESAQTSRFYYQLKAIRRIQTAFHVTLIHRASLAQLPDYWNSLSDMWQRKSTSTSSENLKPGTDGGIEIAKARVQLERIVWDDRVMAIVVRLPDVHDEPQEDELIPGGFKSSNKIPHITIGTAGDNIKPKESNNLLETWLANQDSSAIKQVKIKGNVTLEGSVKAMLSR